MSNTRYLEFDSTYRNRNDWPLPAQFEIPISQHGRDSKIQALDPVSNEAPKAEWCSNEFTVGGGATVVPTITAATLPASTVTTLVVEAPAGVLQPIDDYYSFATLGTGGSLNRRITGYNFLGNVTAGVERAEITIDPPLLTADLVAGVVITITDSTDVVTAPNAPIVFVPDGRIGTNGFANCILWNETTGDSRPILDYSFYGHFLTLNTSAAAGGPVNNPPAWANTDCFVIRQSPPTLIGVSGVNTLNTVILPVGANATDDYYTGDFVRIARTAVGGAAPEGESRRIVGYIGATRTATVVPAFTVVPLAGAVVEVLLSTCDNAVPFNYTGSLVSQSESVCYEIELLNLILPNIDLAVGRGGRIAFYPYVYVELTNVSASQRNGPGAIYSNNPNSTRMLFRAAVDDTPTPLISPFIKIDGDGMVQTVKFKPNDNLRFSVRLQNGEIFQVTTQDTVAPQKPNERVQVSVMFSIKRL